MFQAEYAGLIMSRRGQKTRIKVLVKRLADWQIRANGWEHIVC